MNLALTNDSSSCKWSKRIWNKIRYLLQLDWEVRLGGTPLCGWEFHYFNRRYSEGLFLPWYPAHLQFITIGSAQSSWQGWECKDKLISWGEAWLTIYFHDCIWLIIWGIKVLCSQEGRLADCLIVFFGPCSPSWCYCNTFVTLPLGTYLK